MKEFFQKNATGIGIALLITVAAIFLAPFVPALNGIMMALVLGIIIGNFSRLPKGLAPGIGFSSSKILEFSIVLMAFTINIQDFRSLGVANISLVLLMMLIMMLATVWFARRLKCPESTGHLVGFGTIICGSSAIAAVAPGISKNQGDIAIALAVVNLMGSVGMLALPIILAPLGLSSVDSGVIIGGTLHSVGNVAGAGYGMEKSVGDLAISVKMARVAMLTPAVIFFTYLVRRKDVTSESTAKFSLPIYLWAFVAVSILVSAVKLPTEFTGFMGDSAKFFLSVSMAAIGLKVSFSELYRSGRRAIGFGAILFGVQIAVVISLMLLFKLVF